MTPADARRALLGDTVYRAAEMVGLAAPDPEPGEWINDLRRVFLGHVVQPTAEAA